MISLFSPCHGDNSLSSNSLSPPPAVGAITSKFEGHISELTKQLVDVRRVAEDGAAREGELR